MPGSLWKCFCRRALRGPQPVPAPELGPTSSLTRQGAGPGAQMMKSSGKEEAKDVNEPVKSPVTAVTVVAPAIKHGALTALKYTWGTCHSRSCLVCAGTGWAHTHACSHGTGRLHRKSGGGTARTPIPCYLGMGNGPQRGTRPSATTVPHVAAPFQHTLYFRTPHLSCVLLEGV